MPTSALLLALAAAVVHALWNVLLARAEDVEAATAVALIVAEVAFAPVAVALWHVEASVWPYLVATGALQLAYFTLLTGAYRRVDLSVVYPLARGGAPVLVLLAGAGILGVATSWAQVAGVALVALGVVLIRGLRRADRRSVAFGLAIACCIASYTVIDKRGLRHAGAVPYLELSMLGPTLLYASGVAVARGRTALRRQVTPATVLAGICTFGAYALVLVALRRAAAAPVAAVRETSVVFAVLLARRLLAEPVGPGRIAGAALVAGGVALLALA